MGLRQTDYEYGLNFSDLEIYDTKKIYEFIAKYDKQLLKELEEYSEDELEDWFDEYNGANGYYGVPAIICDIINKNENFDLVSTSDNGGNVYIFLPKKFPWEDFNKISKEDFDKIVKNYLGQLTSKEIVLEMQEIINYTDC